MKAADALSVIGSVVGLILVSQVVAPAGLINLPSLRPLKLTKRSFRPRGDYFNDWERFMHGHPAVLQQTPAQLNLHGTGSHGRSWHVGIDVEEAVLGYADWYGLTGGALYDDMGSAGVAVFVLGLPGIIVASPLWLVAMLLRLGVRKLTPLDVDSWAIYLKLRGQLSSADRHRLWWALCSHHNGLEAAYHAARAAKYHEATRSARRCNSCWPHAATQDGISVAPAPRSMTMQDFQRKWGNIRCAHADDCPSKFSFDYERCTCGLDELWALRNADLQQVVDPDAAVAARCAAVAHSHTHDDDCCDDH